MSGSPCWLSGKESAGSTPVSGRSLEKEMATHSSILAWRTPWTEEPVGCSPWGGKGVGHDLATKQQQVHQMVKGDNGPGLGPF